MFLLQKVAHCSQYAYTFTNFVNGYLYVLMPGQIFINIDSQVFCKLFLFKFLCQGVYIFSFSFFLFLPRLNNKRLDFLAFRLSLLAFSQYATFSWAILALFPVMEVACWNEKYMCHQPKVEV